MISLRNMKDEEFPTFSTYFSSDYADDLVQNHEYSRQAAIVKAEKELQQSFPHGANHSHLSSSAKKAGAHNLLCIELQSGEVAESMGYLWYQIDEKDCSAFIYDFYIEPVYRGKGFGKLAINALEKRLGALNVKRIKLRVALHNKRALHLYQEAGFIMTGYNMSKNI